MAKQKIEKGLDGVIVDETAISQVMPETNSLTYRGYAVQDLCKHCCFEEVAYLLWNGELPTSRQLGAFRREERKHREISRDHIEVIKRFPTTAHPMDTLRTAVSYLGTTEIAWGGEPEANDRRRFIRVQPTLDFHSLEPAALAMAEIRRIARDRNLVPEHGVRVLLTGTAAMAAVPLTVSACR